MANLVTLDDYKTYKQIASDTQNAEISAVISPISRFVENYCDRNFLDYYSTPTSEYFDAKTNCVYVKHTPLIAVTSVKVSDDGGITQTTLDENSVDKDGYFVSLEDGYVSTQMEWSEFLYDYDTPHKSLEISYIGGYDGTDNVPQDLKMACYSLIEYYLEAQYQPAKALAGANIDNSVSLSGADLPPHIRRILDQYRIGL